MLGGPRSGRRCRLVVVRQATHTGQETLPNEATRPIREEAGIVQPVFANK